MPMHNKKETYRYFISLAFNVIFRIIPSTFEFIRELHHLGL